ncbi:MAG: branched-chain amino acid ABC transporter permease [Acidimicrobiia bacterium]
MDLDQFLNITLSGLTQGAIYSLLAMGYNVIFATTGVLNFAHGELFMVGGIVGVVTFDELGWPVGVALLAAVLMGALLGVVEERIAVRPATSKGHSALGWVLSTLGFAIILRSGTAVTFGPDFRNFPSIITLEPVDIGGVRIVPEQILLVVAAIVVAIALHAFYERSMVGRALSAVAQDEEAAAMRGIPVSLLSATAFGVGSGIAAFTGFIAGPLTGAFPTIGFVFALKGFVAAAVGGIPRISGALFGGLMLGIVEAFGAEYVGGGYRNVVVFAALLAILAIRPAGLFGAQSVRSV